MTPRRENVTLAGDAARLEALVRALAASVNVRLLAALAADKRKRGEQAWLSLSEAAHAIGEAPGTVAAAVGKLQIADLVDEKREKGRRYFRATLTDVTLALRR